MITDDRRDVQRAPIRPRIKDSRLEGGIVTAATPSLVVPVTHLAAYWTLNEVSGPGTKLDSVSGQHWNANINVVAVPGLFGNCMRFNTGSVEGALDGPPLTSLGYVPSTSLGVSFWFWFRQHVAPGGNIPYLNVEFDLFDTVGPDSGSFILNVLPTFHGLGIAHHNTSDSVQPPNGGIPAITNDVWHMGAVVWDSVAQRLKVYWDGSLIINAVDTLTMGPMNTGVLQAGNSTEIVGSDPWVEDFDEFGISVDGPISSSQVTAIWNAGAGTTWPAVSTIVPV